MLLLTLNSISHLLVDSVCAATLFGPLGEAASLPLFILLYSTLAFSTQCIVGLIADRLRRHGLAAAVSMHFVAAGCLLPLPPLVRVVMIGLGNSVFHVAGGAMTLEASGSKAGPLGVFVAPGAIGLTLGTLFPSYGSVFAVALMPLALMSALTAQKAGRHAKAIEMPSAAADKKSRLLPALLLTFAVAVRAIGGSAAAFPWKTGALEALLLTLFVFLGKTAGGLLLDRMGARLVSLLSVPLAAVLTASFSGYMLPSLAGQLALNLTMPVTLYLICRALPDQPGFAFGLAAAALWPGTVAGRMIHLTGAAAGALIFISFLFGLAAILCSEYLLGRSGHISIINKETK